MTKEFELLKRTFPVSQFDRICDGYQFILDHSTPSERLMWGVNEEKLQRKILKDEKYIYQVAKEGKEFKTLCLSFSNYEIIRTYLFERNED